MEVALSEGIIKADAKTGMVDFNSLTKVGNMFRVGKGLNKREFVKWRDKQETQELIDILKHRDGCFKNKDILISKKGRYGGTWGNLILAIDYAMWLDVEFKIEVIETFINNKILDFRILGIDYYNEMKDSVENLTYRKEKDNHKNFMINLNKKINTKVNGEFVKGWDHLLADADKQAHRKRILDFIKQAFTMDLPKSNEDVWNMIDKID